MPDNDDDELTPLQKQAKQEQALADIRDSMPAMWWALYRGSMDIGFSSAQAFDLLKVFIFSQGTNDRRWTDSNPPRDQ